MNNKYTFCAIILSLTLSALSNAQTSFIIPSAEDSRFGWERGDEGATYVEWDAFFDPDVEDRTFNRDDTPEFGGEGLIEVLNGPIATTGGSDLISRDILWEGRVVAPGADLGDGVNTRVVAQLNTRGALPEEGEPAELDLDSLLLSFAATNDVAPVSVEELTRGVVAGRRGDSLVLEHLITWDLPGSVGTYSFEFKPNQANWVLDNLAVDTWASATIELPDFSAGFDCNDDGQTTAADLICATSLADRDEVLTAIESLAGDLDFDGEVAFSDFLILSQNFGSEVATYAEGNIDLMGGVEFADFLTLSQNFGQSITVAASVPEPSGLTIMAGLVFGVFSVRRHRN